MITYRPRPGCRGNWMEARREAMALLKMLEDPASFAAFLHDEPDATMGLMEPASAEVVLFAERIDGALVLRAEERPQAALEA